MTRLLRRVARGLLGVERPLVYYLPWLERPGLECVLILSNVEARFKPEYKYGPFKLRVTQYDATGLKRAEHRVELSDSTDVVELPLSSTGAICGYVAGAGSNVMIRIPPMGSHLLNVANMVPSPAQGTGVVPLRLEGNAWFNLYVVGAVHSERSAQLSLMHVK